MFDQAFLAQDEASAIRGNTPTEIPVVSDARLTFHGSYVPLLLDLSHILTAITLHMTEYKLSTVCDELVRYLALQWAD